MTNPVRKFRPSLQKAGYLEKQGTISNLRKCNNIFSVTKDLLLSYISRSIPCSDSVQSQILCQRKQYLHQNCASVDKIQDQPFDYALSPIWPVSTSKAMMGTGIMISELPTFAEWCSCDTSRRPSYRR